MENSKLRNKIMLITYADSLGKNLKELKTVLDRYFGEAVDGVHILPFFPSSADRGFAPMRYDRVDEAFGDFSDIAAIAETHPLMFDFMVNHISRSSEYFQDFLQRKDASPYKDLFIRYKDFWPGGAPTREQVDKIYKRKPRAPSVTAEFADGTREEIWCTFGEEQIDLDVSKPFTRRFIRDTVKAMCERGAALIRLDAFAYAVKKPDTSCFFIEPEMWELLEEIRETVEPYGVDILPEIHEHYSIQLKLAQRGYWVYDFALPMLVLHALYTGRGDRLKHWLDICPRKQFTTLDTHDGIGVVDVADLLSEQEIEETRELLFTKGANVKKSYNTAAYNNLDIYQINCTYYSALGNNDEAYLLARAIQFFAPGIPQVYYVGALAGANDIERLEATRQGRDINRHAYTLEEVARETQRPVVKRLLELMRLRNSHPAFGGECRTALEGGHGLTITRVNGGHRLTLRADLKTHEFSIE
ncbi:MAG TPA: sucrose phosphorylase [Firmicutes bacterium]|nr:sucrose phosphorylase [Bacillota bacterium]